MLRTERRTPQPHDEATMRVVTVPCLADNYAYLVISSTGETAIVDASEAEPVRRAVEREGVTPRFIWSTHHHWDHVGGNEWLARELGLEVVGHVSDRARLPAITRGVDSGDKLVVGDVQATCMHIPGHTLGAVAYFVETPAERVVFTGDTLFCGGCGRLFEGTPAQMHDSLSRLAALPADTRVYCGHEYTLNNLRFAASVEPSNAAIGAARDRATSLRQRGEPSVGTTIRDEKQVNPFLRVRSPEIRAKLGIASDADDESALAVIRRAKDAFR
jgi:hydroxyacylglutathione hydrolase